MLIAGLQKLTLLDFPGHCAATVFTPGCDLRCPFCHNASLVLDANADIYDQEKILEFLKERKGRLTGLAITGGEPLLQNDIEDFMAEVKAIGYKLKLDTNGTYPKKLAAILERGLADYVAMDVKSSWTGYPVLIGLEDAPTVCAPLIKNVQDSMEMLKNGNIEFEFRTTIVNPLHKEEDIEEMAKAIGNVQHYFLQSFKDSGDVLSGSGEDCRFSAYEKPILEKYLEIAKRYIPNTQLRGVD
ncbi:MAG: anaerobic ribonucleoside-triphosphate reductase activating protein [Bacillota bacterium]|nr:anaerobic ribonucleoside-triphosphate reductase activating protein [Bacillota bacterium]